MPVSYITLTPPSVEPITLSDAQSWLRIDFTEDNAMLSELISDARHYAEKLLHRSLATTTIQAIIEPEPPPIGNLSGPVDVPYDSWRLAERPDIPLFGNWLVRLQCPMGPVQSVTTVEYQLTRMDVPEWTTLATPDSNGNDTYRLDNYADPAEVNIFTILAATRYRLTYQAGYTTLPFDLRRTLLRLIAFWYDNRSGEPVPDGIRQELAERRVITF